MQKVKAKIHLNGIKKNAEYFRNRTQTRLCAVVKANAYGHGAEEIVNALEGIADCFAVALIEEAVAIRTAACGRDILVFTPPVNEEEAYALAVGGFIATIPDLWTARLLQRVCESYGLCAKVHLKTNTGMNRYGMHSSMLGKVCNFLQASRRVRVEGVYSHLYRTSKKIAIAQKELFLRHLQICRRYFPEIKAHLSATYGSLLGQDFAFDMVRVGIGLYGYLPALEQESGIVDIPTLYKGMTVRTRTIVSRKISFGGLGYGDVPQSERQAVDRISICRVGYADGFLRQAQNGMQGQEENANALCMDVCLKANKKRRGQMVTLLTDAEKIALATQTISYEVLCAATRRAEFIYEEN